MKQNHPEIKPIDYNKWNKINGISFVSQKEQSKFSITPSVSNKVSTPVSKSVSKPVVVSMSLSKIKQMSSNNPFNTSDARSILDDVKTRIGGLQETVKPKTNITTNIWFSSFDDEMKKFFWKTAKLPDSWRGNNCLALYLWTCNENSHSDMSSRYLHGDVCKTV